MSLVIRFGPGDTSTTTTATAAASPDSTGTGLSVATGSIVPTAGGSTSAATVTASSVTPATLTPTSRHSASILSSSLTTTPSTSSSSTTNVIATSTSSKSLASSTSQATSSPVSSPVTTTDIAHPSSSTSASPNINNGQQGTGGGGLSTGAKVGIAIGTLGGLAIIGVILALFLRKRSRRQRHDYSNRSQTQATQQPPSHTAHAAEKVPPIASVWTPSTAPEREVLLPQQADDATVQSRFSTLYDHIELHIENFYTDTSPMIPPATEGALSRYDTPLLSGPLAHNLEESPRATALLKHVLSYEITTTIISPIPGKRSLLPTDLLVALQEYQTQQDRANPRTLSHLRHLATTHRQNPTATPTPQTTAAAQHFTSVFSIWSNPSYSADQRTQHLSSVLSSAVDFAIWLLSQPDTFVFPWDDDTRDGGGDDDRNKNNNNNNDRASIVTAPALVKVMHDGQRLAREQVLSRAVYRQIWMSMCI